MLKKVFRFIANNFVFVGGTLFVFVMGFFYAYLKPQGLLVNLVFLAIALGWIIFIIFYIWEVMDKDKKEESHGETEEVLKISDSSDEKTSPLPSD